MKTSRHFPILAFRIQPLEFPTAPRKPLNFVQQNLRKPQQNPTSSTLVNPKKLLGPGGDRIYRIHRMKFHELSGWSAAFTPL
jgi:hypothetical protein